MLHKKDLNENIVEREAFLSKKLVEVEAVKLGTRKFLGGTIIKQIKQINKL